jgi:Predicted pyridoxal phosphate-dependent enzyme apparently involved in regulation of cell wall biogenesis
MRLILSLKALGVSTGDEVITVANTFYATVGAIVACGAKPVFVDCDERYQINAEEIEDAITNKTKAVIPVHWGGASPNMNQILDICKKYNIFIVEDACMGIGAKVFKKKPGSFGHVNAFSMHPLKSLNVMGDGGMVVTNSLKIYKWLLKYRNHGMINRDYIDIWGVNMRLQPLQAVVALEGIKKLNSTILKRNLNAKILDKNLKSLYPNVILPKRKRENLETFALYMARFKKRDKLKTYLEKNGIEVKIHYPIPLHLQKPGKKLGYKSGDFKNAEIQSKQLLTLPDHQFLTRKTN